MIGSSSSFRWTVCFRVNSQLKVVSLFSCPTTCSALYLFLLTMTLWCLTNFLWFCTNILLWTKCCGVYQSCVFFMIRKSLKSWFRLHVTSFLTQIWALFIPCRAADFVLNNVTMHHAYQYTVSSRYCGILMCLEEASGRSRVITAWDSHVYSVHWISFSSSFSTVEMMLYLQMDWELHWLLHLRLT